MQVRNLDVKIVKGNAPVPGLEGEVNEHTVRAAYAAAIREAAEAGETTVTLPSFGVDEGFPLVGSAKIAAQEVLRAGREGRGPLQEIVLALDNGEAFLVFEKHVYGYLRHVMEDMAWGPYVTADIIIEINDGIVLIERSNPPYGWALPGGFVDYGESLEDAARREAKEETNLDLEGMGQFFTYSDPSRDPRFHTVTAVFAARGVGIPKAGDDAKGLKVVPFADLRGMNFAFDHAQVISDYLASRGM